MATIPQDIEESISPDDYVTVGVDPESGEIQLDGAPDLSATSFIEAAEGMDYFPP